MNYYVLFLIGKKRTKRSRIKRGLFTKPYVMVRLPLAIDGFEFAARSATPLNNLPSEPSYARGKEHERRKCSDFRPSALRFSFQTENRDIFCLNRSYSKVLSSSPVRAEGFQRERLCLREQAIQRPFGLILLVLFLQK